MTDANAIKAAVRSTYDARVRGDLEGTIAAFAEDVVFEFNGQGTGLPGLAAPVTGKAAVRPVMQQLIDNFRFTDREEVSLLVEAEKAALHWRAIVTFTPNGRSAKFDVFDFYKFRDGKIAVLRQSTDSAMVKTMVGT
jgi:ketosteroid isomerase-like protein